MRSLAFIALMTLAGAAPGQAQELRRPEPAVAPAPPVTVVDFDRRRVTLAEGEAMRVSAAPAADGRVVVYINAPALAARWPLPLASSAQQAAPVIPATRPIEIVVSAPAAAPIAAARPLVIVFSVARPATVISIIPDQPARTYPLPRI